MRRNPLLLGDRIKHVLNRDAVVVTHVFIVGIVLIDTILSSSATTAEKIAIYAFLFVLSMFGVARYFNLFNVNNYPGFYLVLYHFLLGSGLIFFSPLGSNYVFVWLILLFLTNFFFGVKPTIASGMVLVVVLELQLLWYSVQLGTGIDASDIATLAVQLVIIFAVAMFFVNTQSVSDQDRHLLVTSMDKAQLERQRLISLINSMFDAVIATDDKGAVKLYNAAALNILDTNEDLTGKPIESYLSLCDQQGEPVRILELTHGGTQSLHSSDYLLKGNNDEEINISLSISPIKLGFRRDSERGYIISFRDITREKSLEEERDEFISVISHELRTPVAVTEASISNALFIAHKKKADDIAGSLEEAHKQALFLAGMLNDLSTLSRAEKGKLDQNFEAFDTHELMNDLEKEYTPQATAKALKLSTHIDDKTPSSVISNRLYVKEILQNFITNAIKYTKEGSVSISLSPHGESGDIMFSVTDTGIGISKSDQQKIFRKFYRSEDYRTRESNGTGLGLYITKKLASIISASFEVKSKLNEGSTFSIIIPTQDKSPAAPKK